MKTVIKSAIFTLLVAYCTLIQALEPINQPQVQEKTITVWIHGTRQFFSRYFLHNFFEIPKGLNNAKTIEEQLHTREIAEILHNNAPEKFPLEDLYFYGWSGNLSFKARHEAARILYNLLQALVEEYKKNYGDTPKIRIISHSHGGNIALNLARFNENLGLVVNELVLLACPVQSHTCYLTSHPTFEKVYSLYSRFDSLQVIDPQQAYYWLNVDLGASTSKPNNFFSQRLFPAHDKLHQVELKYNYFGPSHLDFIMNPFVERLPNILALIDDNTTNKNLVINISKISC